MEDVASWLERLGLTKYLPAFTEHEIDSAALPHLTNAMLEQIGLPVGPRAKVLGAIARLHVPRQLANGEIGATPGERRQITVLFCDIVDSTKLASQLDPEDFGRWIQAYQRACAGVALRYEGHVAQYLGDGVEVLFGWPSGQEDAAERAVRAGLDIIEAVKTLNTSAPISVRIGIATGIVVVGLQLPESWSATGPVGEVLHIASRMQNLAASNSVLISDSTSRLIAARFEQEDLGLQAIKGVPDPVRVFRVTGLKRESSRFHTAAARVMTPLVGRISELAVLRQRWREAKDEEGRVVFLSGVAGIGKSRLAFEFETTLEHDPHISISLQCLPHCMQSALFPVVQCIERLVGLEAEDSDAVKLRKLEKLVSAARGNRDEITPLLADVMSVPTTGRYPPVALPALQRKTRTLNALVALLFGAAKRRPLFCLVEDAQWIDPSTQELLDLLVSGAASHRLLLIVTHRPEHQAAPRFRSHINGMTMTRLGRREATEMAHQVLPEELVSAAVIKKVIDESDAIPLFIEELARGAYDKSGNIDLNLHDDHAELRPPGWVPDSLRDSLVARLDRAPQARNVAQTAAVIGREFSYATLLRVSSLKRSELDAALSHLTQSDIINIVETRPTPRYAFRHALLRDAAYDSLLRSSRRGIHAKVAAALEAESPELAAVQPELLAYHYTLAADAQLASRYWLAGARRARDHWANAEAIVQFQKALESLAMLPNSSDRTFTELEIQLSLGFCCIAAHGYSADTTRDAFERAQELGEQAADTEKQIQAVYGLWGHFWMRARHDRALEIASLLLEKAQNISHPMMPLLAHRALGSTLFTFGQFTGAREHLERAVVLGASHMSGGLPPSFAVAPSIAAELLLAWDLWILGYPDQACVKVHQIRRLAEQADPYTAAFAHYVTSAVHLLRGEYEISLVHADRSFEISANNRINLYALYSRFGRGCALLKLGQHQTGLSEIRAGIEEAQQSQLGYMRGFMLGWLATAQVENGDPELGLSTIDLALADQNDVAGHAWEAELRRLKGKFLLAGGPSANAEAAQCYGDAAEAAYEQRARSLELRIAISWAKLLRTQNKLEDARHRLAAVWSSFDEGRATMDGSKAAQLLAELRSAS
jgi:class 3 adenylate cyclase